MSDPFRTPADYELFLYSLTDRYPSARSSTLVFVRRGATLARVVGEIHFAQQIKIVVRERLLYNRLP
jgi:hypothetical protein